VPPTAVASFPPEAICGVWLVCQPEIISKRFRSSLIHIKLAPFIRLPLMRNDGYQDTERETALICIGEHDSSTIDLNQLWDRVDFDRTWRKRSLPDN
jgi:hypothetical protein